MAISINNLVEVTNISTQGVTINVQRKVTADVLPNGGPLKIHSKGKVQIEESRLDMQQLKNLAKQGTISYIKYNTANTLDVTGNPGT